MDRVIDSTKDESTKLSMMVYTMIPAATEDSTYMRKLFGQFQKTFLKSYPENEATLKGLVSVLDMYAAGNIEPIPNVLDSVCKRQNRSNPKATCYIDYFWLNVRNIIHEEYEHPFLDSLFLACVRNTEKENLPCLTSLAFFSRGNLMSSHENKPDYAGDHNEKYELLDSAAQYARLDGNEILRMKILAAHGRFAGLEGKFRKCQEYCLEALRLATHYKDSSTLAITYTMIGIVNLEMKNYKESERYSLLNYDLALGLGDYPRIATACGRLMELYDAIGDTAKALFYGRLSVTNSKKAGNKYSSPLTLGNYGEVLFDLGFIDSAKYYQKIALDLRLETGNKEGELYSYTSLAEIALFEKDYTLALDYCNKAWAIEEEKHYETYNARIYHHYYSAYSGLKNWEKALQYLEKYSKTKRQADSLNNASDIMAMQSEFDARIVENQYDRSIMLQKLAADSQQKTAAHTRNLLIGGLIILVLVAGLILRGFTQKRKANLVLSTKNEEIEMQKSIVEEKQKEILDSITYAKRIQYTLLAHENLLKENLAEHFVLFKPKDIVSGDFYWATATEFNNKKRFYLAVCDSTGHGVPGAFMSLLNISFLNEAITEKKISECNLVLNHVRERLTNSVSIDGAQDGMDGTLICFDKSKRSITYSSAYNTPIIISNGRVQQLPADKMPIGRGVKESEFSLHTIACEPGDMIYLFTDGYADQFGGPRGKKFKYKQLHELLLANCSLSAEEQKTVLERTIEDWRGNLEQVDDICVVGIRIS